MSLVDDLLGFGEDPENAESQMKNGGLVPEGKHYARLDGVREVEANSGSRGRELTFTVLAGPGKGGEVRETLWLNTDKDKSKIRQLIFGHRLGLLKKAPGPNGKSVYQGVEGKHDFTDCLGAECVLDVKHEEYVRKDGKKGMSAILQFEGVFSPTDERCKDVPRVAAGSVPPPKPQAKAQDDWGGLV